MRKKTFFAALIFVIVVSGMFLASELFGQDIEKDDPDSSYDSLLVANSNVINWEVPKMQMSINYNGFIEITNDSGNTLIIDFANDTIKTDGYVLEENSFAEVFCWAVIEIMNNGYNQRWEQVLYMENKYEEYRAKLEPKYLQALDLYIKQITTTE